MAEFISEFWGMTVLMGDDPSDAQPHIDVLYECEISKFNLDTMEMYKGNLSPLAQETVRDWISENRLQLATNWQNLSEHKPLKSIDPIE